LSIVFQYQIGKLDTEENTTIEINKLSTNKLINLRQRFLSPAFGLTTYGWLTSSTPMPPADKFNAQPRTQNA
jgi:hypothetical protein